MAVIDMLTETGQIVRFEGNVAWVQTIRHSVCGTCQARKGCGQNLLNQLTGTITHLEVRLDSSGFDVQEGDHVEIGIEEGAVVVASLLAYGLPLISCLLGIILADRLNLARLGLFFFISVGLGIGIVLTRLLIKNHFHPTFFEPVLLRRISKLS